MDIETFSAITRSFHNRPYSIRGRIKCKKTYKGFSPKIRKN